MAGVAVAADAAGERFGTAGSPPARRQLPRRGKSRPRPDPGSRLRQPGRTKPETTPGSAR